MKHIYNNKILRDRRKELRHNQTKTERVLWRYLSKRQSGSKRFFRQYSVGGYIIDFYCPKARLAIELDGGGHTTNEQKLYDAERTEYLNGNNIKVLRFWNADVINDIDGVIAKIIESTK
ncbi:hypothetical protein A2930_03040 [Candidatus Giovannonibacteria bacterium RIFCSPLOWO2_01_FULL_45_34]|uniref:DUF559 domain-containing protein n=1 Tax=Candidatus Giovannonibacteria bacterium RIFCSPLOWO2_01_FULL_45_34 TaxID=1798351 RepID=A0A1F5WZ92_9BACT|nr:MAG: hypothetical protein A3C73_03670 [Candidatus Giovannonibacteria bacterium RIFCSPHIGHO2_02_FULL_44_11]OGF80631.1 MAG: hypothetical protein A2930_03040 [Candidatus Giovannonibacteria bacterium RIFCSPLOWO2_01_FULL_45_34]